MYAMFACSCPTDSREDRGFTAAKELFHLIFPALRQGSEIYTVSTRLLPLSDIIFDNKFTTLLKMHSDMCLQVIASLNKSMLYQQFFLML